MLLLLLAGCPTSRVEPLSTPGLSAAFGPVEVGISTGASNLTFALGSWGTAERTRLATDAAWSGGERREADRGGITEWWTLGQGGIEQGFTVPAPPGDGDLLVNLRIQGADAIRITPDRVALDAGGGTLSYDHLVAVDAGGRTLPASFEPAAEGIRIRVDVSGAAWPVSIDPLLTAAWVYAGEADYAYVGYNVGPGGDTNGDGYDDVAFLTDTSNQVNVFLGGPDGPGHTPDWTLGGPFDTPPHVSLGGDANGDGYADALVGDWMYGGEDVHRGQLLMFSGGTSGLDTVPSWTATGEADGACLGLHFAWIGDINADGYDELVTTHGDTSAGANVLAVHLGGASGPSAVADASIVGARASHFGYSVAGLHDLDGDGYDDFGVGDDTYTGAERGEGAAWIWYGGGLPGAAADAVLTSGQAYAAQGVIAGPGDVDGDGYADVLAGAYAWDGGETNEGRVALYRGGATGPETTPGWTWEPDVASTAIGGIDKVAAAGDTNGDGYADLLVGDPGAQVVYLFHGAPGLPGTAPDATLTVGDPGMFGHDVEGPAGDVNGDGVGEILIGDYEAGADHTSAGEVWLWYGSRTLQIGDMPSTWDVVGVSSSHRADPPILAADFNADGYDDLAMDSNTFWVGLGSATGPGTTVWDTFVAQSNLCAAGDLNGDGYPDVVASYSTSSNYGTFYLAYGGSTGMREDTFTGDSAFGHVSFGAAVAGVGDVDADGYDDVLVGAPDLSDGQMGEGGVFLYRGGAAGLAHTWSSAWECDIASCGLGTWVSPAGDANGDGYADVFIGSDDYRGSYAREGLILLVLGRSSGLGSVPAWSLQGGSNYAQCDAATIVGDVNGDGHADALVQCPLYDGALDDVGRVALYYGDGTSFGTTPAWTVEGTEENSDSFGDRAVALGDVNGDGYDDFAFSETGIDISYPDQGAVYLYFGGADGPNAAPDYTFTEPYRGGEYGYGFDGGFDIDADGHPEIAIKGFGSTTGVVRIYELMDEDGDGALSLDDCDDADPARFPSASESCNGVDDNCDGSVDEAPAADAPTWFADVDGDGYGDPAVTVAACTVPAGFVGVACDCDDGDAAVTVCSEDSGVDTSGDSGVDTSVDSGVDTSGDSGVDTSVDSGVDTSVDSGVDTSVDSGVDTSVDSGVDTSVDSGVDTSIDTGVDTSVDSGADTSGDSGVDTSVDSGVDTSVDSGVDTSGDSGVDTSIDSGVDTSVDSGVDTSVDSGVDSGVDTSGDSGADTSVDSGVDTAGDSGVDTSGDSGADTSGDSGVDTSGDSGEDTSGDSGVDTSGDSGVDTSGDSGVDTSGDSGVPAEEPKDAEGCGCAEVAGPPALVGWGMALGLLVLRRRRREG